MTNTSVVWAWTAGDGDQAGPWVGVGVLAQSDFVIFLQTAEPPPADLTPLRLLIRSDGVTEPAFAHFGLGEVPSLVSCAQLFTPVGLPQDPLPPEPVPTDEGEARAQFDDYLARVRAGFDPDLPVPPPPTGPFPPIPDWPRPRPAWPKWMCYVKPSRC